MGLGWLDVPSKAAPADGSWEVGPPVIMFSIAPEPSCLTGGFGEGDGALGIGVVDLLCAED